MIYQKLQQDEYFTLVKLTLKNAIASALYMLLRINADFTTGEITFNYRTFKELNLLSSDRMKFSRALDLLEKIGLIKKVSADKNGTKAIIVAYTVTNDVTKESLETVSKTDKNLNESVTKCYNKRYKDCGTKSVDTVNDSEIVVTKTVTSSVTHDQLNKTLNDIRLIDPKSKIMNQITELNDNDLPIIDNDKPSHPITDFADYKKVEMQNFNLEALSHALINEALKHKLADNEAKYLIGKLNQANQKMITNTGSEIKNKMAYFQKMINAYIVKKSETVANSALISKQTTSKNPFKPMQYDPNNPLARRLSAEEIAKANEEVPF